MAVTPSDKISLFGASAGIQELIALSNSIQVILPSTPRVRFCPMSS